MFHRLLQIVPTIKLPKKLYKIMRMQELISRHHRHQNLPQIAVNFAAVAPWLAVMFVIRANKL